MENGCGIIAVNVEYILKFNEFLSDYYTNDNLNSLKKFVYENCLEGIVFEKGHE